MAQKTIIHILDDIDGSPAERTVTFGWSGQTYEIDLSEKNAAKMGKALAPFIAGARKVATGSRRPSRASSASRPRAELAEVRAWAKSQPDLTVSDRGRIPDVVFKAFEAAH